MPRGGHLDVRRHHQHVPELGGHLGKCRDSWAVNAIVVCDQNAHAMDSQRFPCRAAVAMPALARFSLSCLGHPLPRRVCMKVTLIHNPKAGQGETPDGERLVELVRAEGHKITYQSSRKEG